MTGICSWFCSPEGVINGSCENYGFFLTWGWPFQDCGGWLAGCVQGRELGARTLSSGVYPGGEDIVCDCHLFVGLQS